MRRRLLCIVAVALLGVLACGGLVTLAAPAKLAMRSAILLGVAQAANTYRWELIDDRGKLLRKLPPCTDMGNRTVNGRFVLCMNGRRPEPTELRKVDLSTGASTSFFNAPAGSFFDAPARWSPDGKRVVTTLYERTTDSWRSNVVSILVSQGAMERITNYPFVPFDAGVTPTYPTWSPDGKLIYYTVENQDGGLGLHEFNYGTRVDRVLAKDAWLDFSVSPDGQRIAYGNVAGAIRQIEYTGRRLVNISNRAVSFSRWSPDGRKLAYQRGTKNNVHPYVYNAKTRKATKLPQKLDGDPIFWAPDSKRLLIHSRALRVLIVDLRGKVLRKINRTRVSPSGWAP